MTTVAPLVCGHPSISAEFEPYLEPVRPSFIRLEFTCVLVVVMAKIILANMKVLNYLTTFFAAAFLAYAAWFKEATFDHVNWVNVCAPWSADRNQIRSFLYSCITGWVALIILDLSSCLLIFRIPKRPRKRRKYRLSQRQVMAAVVFLVLNGWSAVGQYMHSDLQLFRLLTSDPWVFVYFGAAVVGRLFTVGLQGCIFSRGLLSRRWTFLSKDDPRRQLMSQSWLFNAAMLIHTIQCIMNYHSAVDFCAHFVHLLYCGALLLWSLTNSTWILHVMAILRPIGSGLFTILNCLMAIVHSLQQSGLFVLERVHGIMQVLQRTVLYLLGYAHGIVAVIVVAVQTLGFALQHVVLFVLEWFRGIVRVLQQAMFFLLEHILDIGARAVQFARAWILHVGNGDLVVEQMPQQEERPAHGEAELVVPRTQMRRLLPNDTAFALHSPKMFLPPNVVVSIYPWPPVGRHPAHRPVSLLLPLDDKRDTPQTTFEVPCVREHGNQPGMAVTGTTTMNISTHHAQNKTLMVS